MKAAVAACTRLEPAFEVGKECLEKYESYPVPTEDYSKIDEKEFETYIEALCDLKRQHAARLLYKYTQYIDWNTFKTNFL